MKPRSGLWSLIRTILGEFNLSLGSLRRNSKKYFDKKSPGEELDSKDKKDKKDKENKESTKEPKHDGGGGKVKKVKKDKKSK